MLIWGLPHTGSRPEKNGSGHGKIEVEDGIGYSPVVYFSRLIQIIPLFFCCLALTACPKRVRMVGAPKIAVPQNGAPSARMRFEDSRRNFETDAKVTNSADFAAIVRDFPNDPIVPHALLYGAQADLRADDASAALEKLSQMQHLPKAPTDPLLIARASLFRGLSLAILGRGREAYAELLAGKPALNPADSSEVSTWHIAFAEANADLGKTVAAIYHYDLFWERGSTIEKTYVSAQIVQLGETLSDAELQSLFASLQHLQGPAMAHLGGRVAALWQGLGDMGRANSLRVQVTAAQRNIGMEVPVVASSGPGNSGVLGTLLPLSGRLNRIGELSMRGLVLASGSFRELGEDNLVSPFELIARDTGSKDAVAEGYSDLVDNAVLAIVGPFDSRSVAAVGPLVAKSGVSLISLAPRGLQGDGIYSIRHSAEDRARSLARYAYGKGVRDFAIFAPRSSYGTVVGGAFRSEVIRLGGTIVVEATYAKGATTFKEEIEPLKKPWKAIFVPDLARTVELIAPSLASANMNARPLGTKSKHGRSILLLSTAEGIESRYLRSSGRYSLGAVFAPGFYPDRTDPVIAEFVSRYEALYDSEPLSHEAYAFDAAALIRSAVDAGVQTRTQLAQSLTGHSLVGLTGTIRFGLDGKRADRGLLFEIKESVPGQYQLQAIR